MKNKLNKKIKITIILLIVILTFIITRFSIIDKIKKIFYTDYKINENIKYMIFYGVLGLLVLHSIILLF